jgi:hypothetical protein
VGEGKSENPAGSLVGRFVLELVKVIRIELLLLFYLNLLYNNVMSSDFIGEAEPSVEQWIGAVFQDRDADAAVAEGNDMLDLQARMAEHGRNVDEQMAHDHTTDVGVLAKNRLLARIAELADDPVLHVGAFMTLLDRQAIELEGKVDGLRNQQFMGMWDMFVAIAKDEELMGFFRDRPDNY